MCQDGKELHNRRADKTRWNVECRGMVGDGEDAVSCDWQVKMKVADGYIIKCEAAHTCVGRATSGDVMICDVNICSSSHQGQSRSSLLDLNPDVDKTYPRM